MEIKKNLLRNERKSYLRFSVGIIFFIVSIWLVILLMNQQQKVSILVWFNFGFIILNGTLHMLAGFGLRIEEIFGKAFILINDEKISMKLKVLKKEQSVLWFEIQKINYYVNKLYIYKTDNTTVTFNLTEIDYTLKHEIKECLKSFANEKHIVAQFNTVNKK